MCFQNSMAWKSYLIFQIFKLYRENYCKNRFWDLFKVNIICFLSNKRYLYYCFCNRMWRKQNEKKLVRTIKPNIISVGDLLILSCVQVVFNYFSYTTFIYFINYLNDFMSFTVDSTHILSVSSFNKNYL